MPSSYPRREVKGLSQGGATFPPVPALLVAAGFASTMAQDLVGCHVVTLGLLRLLCERGQATCSSWEGSQWLPLRSLIFRRPWRVHRPAESFCRRGPGVCIGPAPSRSTWTQL